VQRRLRPRIDDLAEEPRPRGARRLAALRILYRLRVGDWRIIYTIDDSASLVTVTTIGHRRDVYR
jgi:mRNA interferase RelE/StbE